MKRVSTFQLILFGFINLPLSMLMSPTASMLPNYYLEYTSITAAALASITVLARVFDGITDPLIGYLSDRTGKRKPWMLLGCLLLMVAVYPLYQPPENADFSYLLGWYLLVTLGWTLVEIPHNTLIAAVSDEYVERNRVVLWRQLLGFVGGILFMAMPMLLLGRQHFTPEVFRGIAVVILAGLPLGLLLVWRTMPEFESRQRTLRARDLWQLWAQVPPLRLYIATQVLFGMAIGAIAGMFIIYSNRYLQLSESIAIIAMPMTIMMVASLGFWHWLLKRVEKHKAWGYSAILLIGLLLCLLGIQPGEHALWQMQVVMSGVGACMGLVSIVLPSMVADMIDYDRWRNKRERAATLFAIQAFVVKCNQGLGGGVALAIAAFMGFKGKGELSESAALGLKLSMVGWPLVLLVPMVWLIFRYRLGRRTQAALRRRLQLRDNCA